MIKAAITEACGIGGDRNKCGVATKVVLHRTNGSAQADPERLCQRGHTMELQRSCHLTEAPLILADPRTGDAACWCNPSLYTTATSETKLIATLRAEQRPLNAAGAATLRGEER